MKIDFLVLAGGGNPDWTEKEFSAEHKNLIDICGKPSISYVLDAIKNSKNEGSIILVGTSILEKAGFSNWVDKFIGVEPNQSLAENVRIGEKAATGDFIVIMGGDIPGITHETINAIVDNINNYSNYEFIVFVVTKDEIERKFPGSKRTYGRIKEGLSKVGNLLAIRRDSLPKLDPLIDKYTAGRKSLISLAFSFGIFNIIKLLITGSTSIPDLEKIFLKTTGLNAKGIVFPYGEIGVDIDKPSDVYDIRNYYSRRLNQ
ncbi:MAG TPA: NTP transferase domain-containing protein [Caldisericia bacterium]|nr:NTP transferase domain-containing protein [Caldisericia bacterium]HPO28404.1 NTP transferase domain-containing protein [Caldisericia bacterium]HXK70517.1 NTP transferase domain-containing protein [Caldisericia bacterium]